MKRIGSGPIALGAILLAIAFGADALAGEVSPRPPQRPDPGARRYSVPGERRPPVAYLGGSTETMALLREAREVNLQIQVAKQKLTTDTKILELRSAFEQANRAYNEALKEELDASSEVAKLRQESAEILAQLRDRSVTTKQRRELSRRRRDVTRRLREIETEIRQKPEITALAEKVQKASRAYEERLTELLKADPETAKLLEKQEKLRQRMSEIRNQIGSPRGKPRKVEPATPPAPPKP